MANSRTRKASSSAQDNKGTANPENIGSDEVRTGFITGATFHHKPVQYAVVDGRAMFEGDINLGPADSLDAVAEAVRSGTADIEEGVVITGSQHRWPNAQLPYEIDSAMPNQARVTDAIAHWEANTRIRFIQRTAANAASFVNYVRFFQGSGCWSTVGMAGGMQEISLGSGCTTGNAIHEIGHTVGLWHEQSREDRDSFVQIHWANIEAGKEHNFNQHITDGDDVNAYDYGSIMHYPRDAFSSNGQDTITPTNPSSAQIGQRNGLSQGDIAAVASMYGGTGTVTIKKFQDDHGGIKKVLDDQVGVKKVNDDPPPKKVFDDTNRFKKVRDDVKPPIKKIRDDGVVIGPRPPIPIPGPGPLGPGPLGPGMSPFLLATAHHADVGLSDDEQAAAVAAAMAGVQAAADAVEEAERNVVALQTALTSATSALAKAQQGYAAAVQMLG